MKLILHLVKKYETYVTIHPLVTIINKNLHFIFIQLIMYMVFFIDHIHQLTNES